MYDSPSESLTSPSLGSVSGWSVLLSTMFGCLICSVHVWGFGAMWFFHLKSSSSTMGKSDNFHDLHAFYIWKQSARTQLFNNSLHVAQSFRRGVCVLGSCQQHTVSSLIPGWPNQWSNIHYLDIDQNLLLALVSTVHANTFANYQCLTWPW